MYVYDLEVMSLNPGQVELRLRSTFIEIMLEPKYKHFHKLPDRTSLKDSVLFFYKAIQIY